MFDAPVFAFLLSPAVDNTADYVRMGTMGLILINSTGTVSGCYA
jgi:hypothetical protein